MTTPFFKVTMSVKKGYIVTGGGENNNSIEEKKFVKKKEGEQHISLSLTLFNIYSVLLK